MSTIKNKKTVLALVVVLSGFAGGVSFAAVPSNMESKEVVTAQLGLALPMIGDLKDIADTGVLFGVEAMHHVSATDSFGANVGYFSFGKDSADNVDTAVSVISTMALFHHDMTTKPGGTPFFESGLGFARTQVNIAESNAGGPAVTRGTNEEDISPTFLLGIGFDMPISGGATFGLSARYQHFFFKVGDVDGGGSLNILVNLRV